MMMMSPQEIQDLMNKAPKRIEDQEMISTEKKQIIKPVVFPPINIADDQLAVKSTLSHFENVVLEICAELGQTELKVRAVLELGIDSVIELPRVAGENLDVYVNEELCAQAEVLVINEKLNIRLSKMLHPGIINKQFLEKQHQQETVAK